MNPLFFTPFILQTLMWAIARPILFVFVRLRVYGKENLFASDKGVILAVNHLSDLDPILIPASLGPASPLMPVFSVALERSFYQRPWPLNHLYGGKIFNMLGAYAVKIGTKGDYGQLLRNHISILELGGTVGIFPEGGRNFEGKVGEAKAGVAYLSWRTGAPIIPVALSGHHEMGPREFFLRKHAVIVSYGKPITKEELFGTNPSSTEPSHAELKNASQVVMARIREIYEKN